ncbi:hemerythrin domain-containing protein [Indioceanicola profundi]|uniref:hemerythrin domain-containing protein n=1 Tax=Indioceanicola profundi TaxID=2220096 RepID=UPI000E6ADCA2|nr:hemerythrin domain-containing protein [Indioceanicola profundi]
MSAAPLSGVAAAAPLPSFTAARSQDHPAQGRHDIYRFPHKAIRHAGAQMLMRLGSAGWEDELESAGLVAELKLLLEHIRRHMAQEEDVIHPALEERLPGFCQVMDRQHRRQLSRMGDLDLLVVRLARCGEAERSATGHELYLAFAGFFGEHLLHMQEEEALILPTLQRLFTDAQLLALEERIFDSTPLDSVLGGIRRLVPALNPAERVELLLQLRGGTAVEVFLAVLERAARPTLDPGDWRDLLRRLELDQEF